MPTSPNPEAVQRLLDKEEIRDAICRYARGVDRGDMAAVRTAYHPDAWDEHGADFAGRVDDFIPWVEKRLAGNDNSMHFLGQTLIEFAGPDLAVAETYFASRRLLHPVPEAYAGIVGASDAVAREGWGRYVDRFERRDGQWRVAHRTVVMEAFSHSIALGGKRPAQGGTWGRRDQTDRVYALRAEVLQAD
ncbi:nuclear transport factor 2 family protein [Pseudorhodoferax sp.]|uniref:nuclear transport factor 2 family protein n=1 Tax=Pseudorhodoferax sp. TaxID=1993553 RepID=UPI0039E2E157